MTNTQSQAHLQAIMSIKKGQRVYIKPEWQDAGDDTIEFIAIEDEDGGRVKISPQLGLPFNPVQVVDVEMLCASKATGP